CPATGRRSRAAAAHPVPAVGHSARKQRDRTEQVNRPQIYPGYPAQRRYEEPATAKKPAPALQAGEQMDSLPKATDRTTLCPVSAAGTSLSAQQKAFLYLQQHQGKRDRLYQTCAMVRPGGKVRYKGFLYRVQNNPEPLSDDTELL